MLEELGSSPDSPGGDRADATGVIDQMSRFILVFGAICWAGVLVDAVVHLAAGDVLVPAAMGLAFILWLTLRQLHESRLAAARVHLQPGRQVEAAPGLIARG